MHHDIRAVHERVYQIRCRCGAVYYKWYAVLVTDFRDAFYIHHIKLRVADELREYRLCFVCYQLFDALRGHGIGEFRRYAELCQITEEIYRSAEQSRAGYHLVARLQDVQQRHCDCRHTARTGRRAYTALNCRNSLFKCVNCGISYT